MFNAKGKAQMKTKFQVIAGGKHVYEGNNYMQAQTSYTRHVGYGNAAVTMIHNGKVRCEFFPHSTWAVRRAEGDYTSQS